MDQIKQLKKSGLLWKRALARMGEMKKKSTRLKINPVRVRVRKCKVSDFHHLLRTLNSVSSLYVIVVLKRNHIQLCVTLSIRSAYTFCAFCCTLWAGDRASFCKTFLTVFKFCVRPQTQKCFAERTNHKCTNLCTLLWTYLVIKSFSFRSGSCG